MKKRFITEKEVSQSYGYSISWLQKQRHLKKPPPYFKDQGKVLYDVDKLEKWFNERMIQ
jgi:hypothetical protein